MKITAALDAVEDEVRGAGLPIVSGLCRSVVADSGRLGGAAAMVDPDFGAASRRSRWRHPEFAAPLQRNVHADLAGHRGGTGDAR